MVVLPSSDTLMEHEDNEPRFWSYDYWLSNNKYYKLNFSPERSWNRQIPFKAPFLCVSRIRDFSLSTLTW